MRCLRDCCSSTLHTHLATCRHWGNFQTRLHRFRFAYLEACNRGRLTVLSAPFTCCCCGSQICRYAKLHRRNLSDTFQQPPRRIRSRSGHGTERKLRQWVSQPERQRLPAPPRLQIMVLQVAGMVHLKQHPRQRGIKAPSGERPLRMHSPDGQRLSPTCNWTSRVSAIFVMNYRNRLKGACGAALLTRRS